ncbi:MAG: Holliday junction resolvase RuvX [Flavobacteriales bacterium]|nr:Holliday junction resolvase RuvX [Flavobacteriales bacterium]MCB9193834.1 Holliday junction resolvase RuvX [Flavobacteriales bacterium]
MARVIGIDHGSKRTGLAVTDPLRIIASALDTVSTPEVLNYLKDYLARETVDGFVVGMPMGLNGRPTDATAGVQRFIDTLRGAFPEHWIETVDERFTSRMAEQTVLASGKGRMARRDKGQLDRISATIILQGWMERRTER